MFVNLTPHTIHLPNGEEIAPSGVLARCEEESEVAFVVDGVPVVFRRYGAVHDLLPERAGHWLIVSHMCRVACPERMDLLSPGDLTRDEAGRITGCTNMVANPWG